MLNVIVTLLPDPPTPSSLNVTLHQLTKDKQLCSKSQSKVQWFAYKVYSKHVRTPFVFCLIPILLHKNEIINVTAKDPSPHPLSVTMTLSVQIISLEMPPYGTHTMHINFNVHVPIHVYQVSLLNQYTRMQQITMKHYM